MSKQIKIVSIVVVALVLAFTSVVNAASPPLQEEGQEYVVQADDWLSDLAEKYLGDPNQWNLIVEATNARAAEDSRLTIIEDPNLIYPGQIVFIPSDSTSASMGAESGVETMSAGVLCQDPHPAMQAFCSKIPIARVHFDPNEKAEFFTCASQSGLENVQVDPNEVTILVPNDGDFDLRGITAAIKVTNDSATLIPRWPGSKFDFSTEFAEKYELPAGEQLELPMSKTIELVKAGELIWTGKYGEPGKAGLFQANPPLRCDPQADFEIEIGPFNPTG